jgi:thioredoxin-related protein
MKHFFLIACFAWGINLAKAQVKTEEAHSEGVHWVTLNEAIELQKKEPKKIMMDVYTKWCGPCKMMAQNTFTNPQVAAYLNEHYYAVKFDAEGNDTVNLHGYTFTNPDYVPNVPGRNGVHQLTQYLRVEAYPTLTFFDENQQYLGPVSGYRTPGQLEIFLRFFGESMYKNILTPEQWQEFEKNFVPTWN